MSSTHKGATTIFDSVGESVSVTVGIRRICACLGGADKSACAILDPVLKTIVISVIIGRIEPTFSFGEVGKTIYVGVIIRSRRKVAEELDFETIIETVIVGIDQFSERCFEEFVFCNVKGFPGLVAFLLGGEELDLGAATSFPIDEFHHMVSIGQ